MAKIIRLENLRSTYSRGSGTPIIEEVTESVCGSCRHLVAQGDSFCWQCGRELEQPGLVEHYHKGEKLSEEDFNERRKLVQ